LLSAIGELMAMSAATPKHLYSIGLIDKLVEDDELVRFQSTGSFAALLTLQS